MKKELSLKARWYDAIGHTAALCAGSTGLSELWLLMYSIAASKVVLQNKL